METNKRTIMKRAHEMRKETGKSMAICLMQSWKVYKLAKRMTKQAVKFAYEKIDGTLRYATGILKNLSDTVNPKVATYFDIEAGAYRSFKIQNLITIY